jgi:hypothetical protein
MSMSPENAMGKTHEFQVQGKTYWIGIWDLGNGLIGPACCLVEQDSNGVYRFIKELVISQEHKNDPMKCIDRFIEILNEWLKALILEEPNVDLGDLQGVDDALGMIKFDGVRFYR